MSPSPCVFAIYLKLILIFGNKLGRFDECQCENDDICFFSRTSVPGDGHCRWLKGLFNPLSIKHRV